MKPSKGESLYEKSLPYLLLLPSFVIGGVVLVYPLLNGIVLGFTSYTLFVPQYQWVGFQNFRLLFSDPVYWEIVFNSLFIIFLSVVIQLIFGLGMALLLNRKILFRQFFRGLVFVIWIIPMVIVALLWMIIYNGDFGILNFILRKVTLLGEGKIIRWLGHVWYSKFAMIITYGWRGIPFFMVMSLAAMQTIPGDIVDSATIDGANSVQRFHLIILPFIKNILLLSGLLSIVRLFQDITLMFVQTQGGPLYSTTTLALHVYKEAFVSLQMSKAAAIGVTWLVFLFVLAFFYVRMIAKSEFIR